MINRILLAAGIAFAGMMMTSETASADNCYRGRGYAAPVYGSYYRAAPIYRSPSFYHSYRSPYSSRYRGGFYGPPVGVGGFGGFGYGYPVYGRGTAIGIGRGGISLNFGF